MTDLEKAVEAAKRVLSVDCGSAWSYAYEGTEFDFDEDCTEICDAVLDLAAPQWQDAPTEDGWYWVEGVEPVCYVYKSDIDESWMIEFVQTESGTLKSELVWTDLNGRRVCPIGKRPQ